VLLKILVWLVALTLVACYGFSVYMVSSMFYHRTEKFETTPQALWIPGEQIKLKSSDGIDLSAWWVKAPDSRGIVVLLHGMDGMDSSSMLGHAKLLFEAGYSSVALDMRGHGSSSGGRMGLAFEETRDVAAVVEWIKSKPELARQSVALLGLSMGGATAIRSAAVLPEVKAVISVSAYSSVDRMLYEGMRLMGAPEWMAKTFRPFMRLALLTLYRVWPATASPENDIAKIAPRPVLLLHGDADSQVKVSHAEILKAKAGEGTELVIFPGKEHCIVKDWNLSSEEDAQYKQTVLEFLDRTLK
jgi:dipeptidyl aminopeptidase/acylaminoacyl peptidase